MNSGLALINIDNILFCNSIIDLSPVAYICFNLTIIRLDK